MQGRPESQGLGKTPAHSLRPDCICLCTPTFVITTLKRIQSYVCPLQPQALLTPHNSGRQQAEAHKSNRKASKSILPAANGRCLWLIPHGKGQLAPATSQMAPAQR